MEQLILKFKLPLLMKLEIIDFIVINGYKKTNEKWSVEFSGSAGYLDHIEIGCCGIQKERNNIIWVSNLRNKNGTLKKKMCSIYHSDEAGVRILIGGK